MTARSSRNENQITDSATDLTQENERGKAANSVGKVKTYHNHFALLKRGNQALRRPRSYASQKI